MRKNMAPKWTEVSFQSRMEVYQNYLKDFDAHREIGDFEEPMSYEQFEDTYKNHIFKFVKNWYEGA